MGYTINCDLILGEERLASYWWPIIFEALGRYQFSFDNPYYQPRHQGYFMRFSHDADGAVEDVDSVEAASFRALWDVICTSPADGSISVAPTFWSTSSDLSGWDIVCHLSKQTLSCWAMSLGPGSVAVSTEENVRRMSAALSRFVALACDLFVESGASTAEFTYERYGVVWRFGAIGAPLTLEWWASPSEHASYDATVEEVTLPTTSTLEIVNPFDFFTQGPPIPLDLPK